MQKLISLVILCVVLVANAAACPESADVTEHQLPKVFRQALESFRMDTEQRREVNEDNRMLGKGWNSRVHFQILDPRFRGDDGWTWEWRMDARMTD